MSEPWQTIWMAIGELREHKKATDRRLDKLETRKRPPTRLADMWPLMAGVAILSAVMSGKISAEQALAMMSRLAGGP